MLYLICIWLLALPIFPSAAYADVSLLQRTINAIEGAKSFKTFPPPASVEVAFSPDGGATALVIKTIAAAKQNIKVAAYSFTSRPIEKALIEAHGRGVDVEIILDHDQLNKDSHSVAPALAAAGIPVHIDIIHTLQHDKYMVIDGKHVETGSFNYTAAAEQHNSENVMVLWDDPKLAAAYAENWQSLWDKAENYTAHEQTAN